MYIDFDSIINTVLFDMFIFNHYIKSITPVYQYHITKGIKTFSLKFDS